MNINIKNSYKTHSHYLEIERITADDSINQGKNLQIHYSFTDGLFGKMLVASTQKGICSLVVAENEENAVEELKKKYPKASFEEKEESIHQNVGLFFTGDYQLITPIKLHVKGTDFQLKVWEALLHIPFGELVNYGYIARQINHPRAYRAVGSAIGDNPVFFLIPCHRVIQASGDYGNYYWGKPLKTTIIKWESTGKQH